jgi:hypothetical protein
MATLDYDPSAGTIMLVTDHGTLEYDGCGPEMEICRRREDGEEERSLWVTAEEAVVLAKMVAYCLDKVKVSPASREVLERVQPRLEGQAG